MLMIFPVPIWNVDWSKLTLWGKKQDKNIKQRREQQVFSILVEKKYSIYQLDYVKKKNVAEMIYFFGFAAICNKPTGFF